MKYVLIALLKVYRLVVSPLYGNVCRYYPSCSAYALRAVEFHGAVKGTTYAVRRVLRCHPWAAGGYDPVPGTPEFHEELRVQAYGAATIEPGAELGSDSVPAGPKTQDQLPHRHRPQGEAVMAKARGVNSWKP